MVNLLSPQIKVKGKEKIGSVEQLPYELKIVQNELSKVQSEEEVKGFMQWVVFFLVHSHIIDNSHNWMKPIVKNDIFTNFVKSF